MDNGVYEVKKVVEKPERPTSNLASISVYFFNAVIFDVLDGIEPGVGGEIQLTDGIQRMIELGLKIYALELKREEIRLDTGMPEKWWDALSLTHRHPPPS